MFCWEFRDEFLERDAVGAHSVEEKTRNRIGLIDCLRSSEEVQKEVR